MNWQDLQKKIERMRSKRLSEADTKRALIEPVLAFLGWDTSDVIEVRNEFRKAPGDNPVDYAMLLNAAPTLFVEAKALDVGIDDRKAVLQTLAYANACGVEWAVLADGDNWRIYNAHAPVDAAEKELRRVCISENRNIEALSLISKASMSGPNLKNTWDHEFNGKRVLSALNTLLGHNNPALVKLLLKTDSKLDHKALKAILPTVEISLRKTNVVLPTSKPSPPVKSSAKAPGKKPPSKKSPEAMKIKLKDLVSSGKVPAGSILTARSPKTGGSYPEGEVTAQGTIKLLGREFPTPSGAGAHARHHLHKKGTPKNYPTDGYNFWHFSGKNLDDYRQELAKNS